jgi:hypothetical protein
MRSMLGSNLRPLVWIIKINPSNCCRQQFELRTGAWLQQRPDLFLNQEMLRKEGYAVSQLRLTKYLFEFFEKACARHGWARGARELELGGATPGEEQLCHLRRSAIPPASRACRASVFFSFLK